MQVIMIVFADQIIIPGWRKLNKGHFTIKYWGLQHFAFVRILTKYKVLISKTSLPYNLIILTPKFKQQKNHIASSNLKPTLKVSKFQKQVFLFSFEPKTEQN